MSGSGSLKRKQADCIRAYRMAMDNVPHKRIAETINIDVKQVKSRILLGERLASLKDENK